MALGTTALGVEALWTVALGIEALEIEALGMAALEVTARVTAICLKLNQSYHCLLMLLLLKTKYIWWLLTVIQHLV